MKTNEQGFGIWEGLAVLALVLLLAGGGWLVWQRNDSGDSAKTSVRTSQQADAQKADTPDTQSPASKWTLATSQAGRLSMRVPDGWVLTSYPQDYFGATIVAHTEGKPATVESSSTAYSGHSLRFRASITKLDDAGLDPQWESPQEGVTETTQDFSIGSLTGKRYKAVFSSDFNQTLYEYVFDLGNGQKLDIVYTVDLDAHDDDIVGIVEEAIKTIVVRK